MLGAFEKLKIKPRDCFEIGNHDPDDAAWFENAKALAQHERRHISVEVLERMGSIHRVENTLGIGEAAAQIAGDHAGGDG